MKNNIHKFSAHQIVSTVVCDSIIKIDKCFTFGEFTGYDVCCMDKGSNEAYVKATAGTIDKITEFYEKIIDVINKSIDSNIKRYMDKITGEKFFRYIDLNGVHRRVIKSYQFNQNKVLEIIELKTNILFGKTIGYIVVCNNNGVYNSENVAYFGSDLIDAIKSFSIIKKTSSDVCRTTLDNIRNNENRISDVRIGFKEIIAEVS